MRIFAYFIRFFNSLFALVLVNNFNEKPISTQAIAVTTLPDICIYTILQYSKTYGEWSCKQFDNHAFLNSFVISTE